MSRATVTLIAQVVISVILLVAGIYFLRGNFDADTKKLASGWVGVVLGYWFH